MGQRSLKRDEMESARGGDNEDAEQEASMRAADASGAVSARPDHDASRKYVPLALAELMDGPAVAGPLESGDNPKKTATKEMDTVETEDPVRLSAHPA